MPPVPLRTALARLVARLLACFDRSGTARRRLRRAVLTPMAFESREAPSDAISALHPIALLSSIGIDPLDNVAPVTLPEPPLVSDGPPPKDRDDEPVGPLDLPDPPKPGSGPSPVDGLGTYPAQRGEPLHDLSIEDDPYLGIGDRLFAGRDEIGGGGPGGGSANGASAGNLGNEPAGGGTSPAAASDSSSSDNAEEPADEPASKSGTPATRTEEVSTNGPVQAAAPVAESSAAVTEVKGGNPRKLPEGIGLPKGPDGPGENTAPTAGGESPLSLTPGGTPVQPIGPGGVQLPGNVPGGREPEPESPAGPLPAGPLGNGKFKLPSGPAGSTKPMPTEHSPVTPPKTGGPTATEGGGGMMLLRGPGEGLTIHEAAPGYTQSGHYTITITQTGSNTSDSFTLVETAVVDYDLSLNPTSQWTWDADVTFEYDFRRGTTTQTGTDGFTTTLGGTGTIVVDGGKWGGTAEANDGNPFTFGFYNYNSGHFSIAGQWDTFGWVETGHGYNSLIYGGTEASTVTVAGQVTSSNFSVWASVYSSNSFAYLLGGSQVSASVAVGTYSLYASGLSTQSSEAVGSVVNSPTAGGSGDSVSASYESQASNSGGYTVSQWGGATTAYYIAYDQAAVSSSLYTTASANFATPSGTATVNGTATYEGDEWQDGTATNTASGSFDLAARTGSDTVSAYATGTAAYESDLNVTYALGGAGHYTATASADYGYSTTARATGGYSMSGATASVTASTASYTVSAGGAATSDLSATFTGTTAATGSSKWGLSLTNGYDFSDRVIGRTVGNDVSNSSSFSETGDYWYSLSVTGTATETSAASSGGTDESTVTSTAYFRTSSSYSLSGTGNDSQWVTGTNTLSSADSTSTVTGTADDADTQIANGRFVHTNATNTSDYSSSTFTYGGTNGNGYSYYSHSTSVRTPASVTQQDTYTETGTDTFSSNLSLGYSNQGTGSYARGSAGSSSHSTSLTGQATSSLGPGGSVGLVADHETVTFHATAGGFDTVTGSATFVADPAVRLEKWGYSFTDDYQFSDDSTGTVVDQDETATDRSTETGHYSYSLSSTSTMTFGGGGSSSGSSTLGLSDSGSDRTTEYAAGNNSYTTTETANFSQWVASSATLSRTSVTANYSGNGGDTATTYQHGEKTHTSTSADPTNSTNSYSYTGSDTGTYAYSGGSSQLSEGPTSTYYAADGVTETVDAGFSWRKGGITFGNQETASFTITENGSVHSRDRMYPTVTQSGTASGQFTPYTGTAWSDGSSDYSLRLAPDATAYPTSASASYWQHESDTFTGTYDGTIARGSYGDTQVHRDQETDWHSATYTTNEHGSPAPDDPNPPTGTLTGGGSSGSSGSSTSSSSSVPSTYTLTAHGGGYLQTVRTDNQLWSGATAATLVTNSLTVQMTGDGGVGSTMTETFGATQAWVAPFAINQTLNGGSGGSVVGTRVRTVTEGNAYTLAATQAYLVSGTAVASGSDTYSLDSSDTTAAQDAFAGSSSPGVSNLFNAAWGASFVADPPTYTATLNQGDSNGYAVDRTVTSGFTWVAGHPTGVAVDYREHQGTLAAGMTLLTGDANTVTQGTITQPVQAATLVSGSGETLSGSLAVVTTHTTSPSGSATAYATSASAADSWGTGTATLHAAEYRQTVTSAGTNAEYRLTDKTASDTHSIAWAWQSGAGGSATATAHGVMAADQQGWNRVHYDPTFSASLATTSHVESTTNARTTYVVPTSLSAGASNGWYGDQTLATAVQTASGAEVWSSYTFGAVSGTHTQAASQSFTVVSTLAPSTYTATTRWATGNDLQSRTISASHSYSNSSYVIEKRDTATHAFTLTHTHQISGSAHQQWITNNDYQSFTGWISTSSSAWSLPGIRAAQETVQMAYTSSLIEAGNVTAVTSTQDLASAFSQQGWGAEAGASNAYGDYSHTANVADAKHEVKTPIEGGATRTVATISHYSLDKLSSSYQPYTATEKYTYSTTTANHLATIQQVGSLTESLNGTLTNFLTLFTHKRNKQHHRVTYTSIWQDETGGQHSSVTWATSPNWDSDTWASEQTGIDPEWFDYIADFMEAALDAAVIMVPLALANIVAPGSGLLVAVEVVYGVMGIKWGYDLGQALYAVGTGYDPVTGLALTDKEYNSLVAGLLGSLAGAAIGGAGVRLANKVGVRIKEVAAGERCGIFQACFAAGTPLRTPDGSKPVEAFVPGDLILSRDEARPDGVVEAKVVEDVFVKTGRVLHLHVGGQVIRTTPEHPFYAYDKGWVPAMTLAAGDRLLGEDGSWVPVEEAFDTGEYAPVYNLRVADWHTYFVGAEDWGFAAWAHNSGECTITETAPGRFEVTDPEGKVHVFADRGAAEGFAKASGWTVGEPKAQANKKPNLNSNDAVSHFGLYEIDVNGVRHKVGKADLNRVTESSGLPTRLHQQVRKLREIHGHDAVSAKIVEDLGHVTTMAAKVAETARLQSIFDATGIILEGNKRSFKPKLPGM
jgi:hypothetical protein